MDTNGTIRVDESFGSIAIYIKVDDNQWYTVYVNPRQGGSYLAPNHPVTDRVACAHRRAFTPKPVV